MDNLYLVIGLTYDDDIYDTYINLDYYGTVISRFKLMSIFKSIKPNTIKIFKINQDNSIPVEYYQYKSELRSHVK